MDNMIKSWMEMEMEAPLPLQNYIRDHIFFFFLGGNHHRTNGDLLDLASSPGSLALTFQKRPWSLGVMEANVRAPEMSCILGYPIPIKSY
jgi:hypothetical protein